MPQVNALVRAALLAIGQAGKPAGWLTTKTALHALSGGGLRGPQAAHHALEQLVAMGFATRMGQQRGVFTYRLNSEGHAAAQAAAQAAREQGITATRRAQGKALGKRPRPAAFSARLWSLVRIRQVVDAGTLASTLVDAVDADQIKRAEATAAAYLRRWRAEGALQLSARRNGRFKCYVLPEGAPAKAPALSRRVAA